MQVAQWCDLPPGVCGQVVEAIFSTTMELLQKGNMQQLDMREIFVLHIVSFDTPAVDA